ncbi:MAG: hypothetical protein OXI64_11155 [Defluviicoccus sp.]|nr:hypothetical protein [Defluviicoccus sp.]
MNEWVEVFGPWSANRDAQGTAPMDTSLKPANVERMTVADIDALFEPGRPGS